LTLWRMAAHCFQENFWGDGNADEFVSVSGFEAVTNRLKDGKHSSEAFETFFEITSKVGANIRKIAGRVGQTMQRFHEIGVGDVKARMAEDAAEHQRDGECAHQSWYRHRSPAEVEIVSAIRETKSQAKDIGR